MRANFSRFARVDSRRVYLLLIITSWKGILFALLNKDVIASRIREIVATINSSSY